MVSFKDLHDATLLSLLVDWASGELRFKVVIGRPEKMEVQLVARGMTSLKCPRAFPWGRSISVNSVTLNRAADKSLFLVEMQSGDVIEASVDDVVAV